MVSKLENITIHRSNWIKFCIPLKETMLNKTVEAIVLILLIELSHKTFKVTFNIFATLCCVLHHFCFCRRNFFPGS